MLKHSPASSRFAASRGSEASRRCLACLTTRLVGDMLLPVERGGLVIAAPFIHAQIPERTFRDLMNPERARFRLVAEDGITQPDGRAYLRGTKVWTIEDNVRGNCFLLVNTVADQASIGPVN